LTAHRLAFLSSFEPLCPPQDIPCNLLLHSMPQYFFHGDLANGLIYSVFSPFHYIQAATELQHSAHPEGLIIVCLVSTGVALSSLYSWHYNSAKASWLSFVASVASHYCGTLFQFPHGDDAMLLIMFFWHLIVCTANMPHMLTTKIRMGLISASGMIFLSFLSPIYTVRENVPYIVGGTGA
jgi:hypothetical protein